LFNVFAIAFSIQLAKACEYPPGYIPVGENVEVFPDPAIGLLFAQVTAEGWATATQTTRYPPPPPPPPEGGASMAATDTLASSGSFIGPVWDIEVTATYVGKVTVRIDYGETASIPTQLLQTDIIPGDVNADGKVNLLDLWIIIKALGSYPGHPRWNPYCDLNGDNKVNLKDLCIAIQHFGQVSVWTNIKTWVDYENHIIYGETDHFSIFAVH
jgi:hypothetical protein